MDLSYLLLSASPCCRFLTPTLRIRRACGPVTASMVEIDGGIQNAVWPEGLGVGSSFPAPPQLSSGLSLRRYQQHVLRTPAIDNVEKTLLKLETSKVVLESCCPARCPGPLVVLRLNL